MKFFVISLAVLTLNSCNTTIGLYRDTMLGARWVGEKIQNSGSGGGESHQGAPVY